MKMIMWLYLLGLPFNTAYAYEAQAEEVLSDEEALHRSLDKDPNSTLPKFSNLIRSTMDILGPADDSVEISQSADALTIIQ